MLTTREDDKGVHVPNPPRGAGCDLGLVVNVSGPAAAPRE
jgi:hypothetical protein